MKPKEKHIILNILLADDDKDDRFFFKEALEELPIATHFKSVNDGERLINYLSANSEQLPDVLFLDLNMPRKNGHECLIEIKSNKKLQKLPVVIYSTSLDDQIADILYKIGAYYYIRKTDLTELRKTLNYILTKIVGKKFEQPSRDKFILSLQEV